VFPVTGGGVTHYVVFADPGVAGGIWLPEQTSSDEFRRAR
jgi:hypothetical protein